MAIVDPFVRFGLELDQDDNFELHDLESMRGDQIANMWIPSPSLRPALSTYTTHSPHHSDSLSPDIGKTIYTPASTVLDDENWDHGQFHQSFASAASPTDFQLLSPTSSYLQVSDMNSPPDFARFSRAPSTGLSRSTDEPISPSPAALAAVEARNIAHHPPSDLGHANYQSNQPVAEFNTLFHTAFVENPAICRSTEPQSKANDYNNVALFPAHSPHTLMGFDSTAWAGYAGPAQTQHMMTATSPRFAYAHPQFHQFGLAGFANFPAAFVPVNQQPAPLQAPQTNTWLGYTQVCQVHPSPSYPVPGNSHPVIQPSTPREPLAQNPVSRNPQPQRSTQVQPLSLPAHGPARPPTLLPAVSASGHSQLLPALPRQAKPNRGGRRSGLKRDVKANASDRRKTGSCWRCAFQRETCSRGDTCDRCYMRAQHGQAYFFPCNRSKLTIFVKDFLPRSMTLMHQKQSIEDCVSVEVLKWELNAFIDVSFTSGWGHALQWRLYEFIPTSQELLSQFQYLQDPGTGQMIRHAKWSPPLGILTLGSEEACFERYMEALFTDDQLGDFAQMCFAEETVIDGFQSNLLGLLCGLYTRTQDYKLKDLIKKILRMMILTYIMGHTLTIVDSTLPDVLLRLRHASPPPGCAQTPHISPRLANRQLKFYFANLRCKVFDDILRWQQATLHGSASKDLTWLPVFCVMLGFAMVLEELQCTLQIQADAKAEKGEMARDAAQAQAKNACESIDERYDFLTQLFRAKYRSSKWTRRGSFGNQTPYLTSDAELLFLTRLWVLVDSRQAHLQQRKDVPLGHEYQCQYTSRLVARFLLPFLSLPQ